MNLNLNPASYWEVAHFYMWGGKGTPTQPHTQWFMNFLFKFCVIDTLPVPVNLFNNLFTLFDANAHKTN